MRNTQLQPGDLLDEHGYIAKKGYSTQGILTYDRSRIKAMAWRIKEWDFYQVSNSAYCIQFTIGHASYAGTVSVTFFEFATGKRYDIAWMLALPFNRLHMPSSAEAGDLCYDENNVKVEFLIRPGERILRCKHAGSKNKPSLDIDIVLSQPHETGLVIATPFDNDPRYFYYNQKINCMPASGYARIGTEEVRFDPDTAFGLLDWGRGVWPFHNEWVWGNGSTKVNGKLFGFNIGWGFGNTSATSENMLLYGGTAHKIDDVFCDLQAGGYMSKKQITSSDGRFEMEFVPVYDRQTSTKLLFINNHCHQLFGKFTGKAILDDGTIVEVQNMDAFIEHAVNNW